LESTQTITTIRIDVWLWAARFFKTRPLAKKACELGRVLANGQPVKPARNVHVGERLQVVTEAGDFEIDILQLSDVRGPAPVAQALYRETEAGHGRRMKAAEERKANRAYAPAPVSRPSKRDRRRIIQFRDKRGY
jgi:ribosome-associated heat shock protein Hsp15